MTASRSTPPPSDVDECADTPPTPSVQTTQEELEAFYTVRAIVRTVVDCRRISLRDVGFSCSVLLDGNAAKPICSYQFDGKRRSVTLYEQGRPVTLALASLNDLYDHAPRLRAIVAGLERDFPAPKRIPEREVLA